MRNFFSTAVIVIFFILLSVNAVSASNTRQTLQGLATSSPVITTGIVSEVSAKIEKDSREVETVYTYVTVLIHSVLKGDINSTSIVIKMFGGRVNGKGNWSEEWIPFKANEEVLLFLHQKDIEKNIWELKSPSAKLPIINHKGIRCFDCSELFPDELSKDASYPFLAEKILIDKVKDYSLLKKGGY